MYRCIDSKDKVGDRRVRRLQETHRKKKGRSLSSSLSITCIALQGKNDDKEEEEEEGGRSGSFSPTDPPSLPSGTSASRSGYAGACRDTPRSPDNKYALFVCLPRSINLSIYLSLEKRVCLVVLEQDSLAENSLFFRSSLSPLSRLEKKISPAPVSQKKQTTDVFSS